MAKKLTQEEFIANAIAVHGDKYSYHLVNYTGTDNHVDIWCNKCKKSFPQTPYKHTKREQGCTKCNKEIAADNLKTPLDDVIKKFKTIHGDKFSYSFKDYKNQKSIVDIVCKVHNFPFTQSINLHNYTEYPCPICLHEFQKDKTNAWSHSYWVDTRLASKNLVAFQLYVCKCWNDK